MIILRGDNETIYIHSAGSPQRSFPRPTEGPADGGETIGQLTAGLAAKPFERVKRSGDYNTSTGGKGGGT